MVYHGIHINCGDVILPLCSSWCAGDEGHKQRLELQGECPDFKGRVRRDQKAVGSGPLCCQVTALPACLFSSCVPHLPGQPLEGCVGAVGAAEMVALQAVGGHKNLFLG